MIINSRSGQRSNRIITIAHGLGTALKGMQKIRITEMDDLKDDYLCDLGREVDLRSSKFWSLERKLVGYVQKIFRCKINIPGVITDWLYRDYESVEQYRDQIVKFFTPKAAKITVAEKFYSSLKRSTSYSANFVLVGVHVRRGDYKEWNGGNFYFEDDVYVRIINEIAQEFISKNQSVGFVIFSNEDVSKLMSRFTSISIWCSPCREAIEDHYLMSKCDFLLGPPSTFTRWASYMGKKPLAYIENRDQTIKLSDFKYMSI